MTKLTDLDLHELFAQRREIVLIWNTEDVKEVRPDLSDDQAWEVLQACEDAHDCNFGFTWDLIRYVANDLYPTTNAGEMP